MHFSSMFTLRARSAPTVPSQLCSAPSPSPGPWCPPWLPGIILPPKASVLGRRTCGGCTPQGPLSGPRASGCRTDVPHLAQTLLLLPSASHAQAGPPRSPLRRSAGTAENSSRLDPAASPLRIPRACPALPGPGAEDIEGPGRRGSGHPEAGGSPVSPAFSFLRAPTQLFSWLGTRWLTPLVLHKLE